MSDREDQLCELAKAGDAKAASNLLSLFYERVFAFFRRLCGSQQDAEDLTQRTFIKVWASIAAYQGRCSFSTWIHSVAHHVYVDWRRKKSRQDQADDDWWGTCTAEEPSPFEDAAGRETAHQLYALVEQLDEKTREAVHLHYYQGLSLKETSEVINMPASTLKYRLRQALDFLRSRTIELKY